MEGKDLQSPGVAPKPENIIHFGDVSPPVPAPEGVTAAATDTPVVSTEGKKKRGRPRKYGPDGALAVALSPMPISAAMPMTGGDYTWKMPKPFDSFKKKHGLGFDSAQGERAAYSVGSNFTPHVINVNPGEDISMKILSFSQQGSRAICIIAANGDVSSVTLRQPNSSGGTLTYEGRFKILSLSGSFTPTDIGGTKSRTGGMSVSLAGPDGRVIGGGLAGLLVAAGSVQVVIGSFLPGYQQEQKPKKQKPVLAPTFSPIPVANHISVGGTGAFHIGTMQGITPAPYHENNVTASNHVNGQTTVAVENSILLPREGHTDVAAEINTTLPQEGRSVEVAENNISLPEKGHTVLAAETNISLPGEGHAIAADENNASMTKESGNLSPSAAMVSPLNTNSTVCDNSESGKF